MKTVVLHPASQKEFNFLISLLERLEVPFDIQEEIFEESRQVGDDIQDLFGSWKSDESGEELIKKIYSARNDTSREVNL
ncbi:MAG: hypothetical protein J5I98_02250 [Phaeodactylibacter sp.]|nr:hypothetical protein [Phaeodactylibacter sp.]